jgi:hypothetical protein
MTIAAPAQADGLRAIVVDDEQLARDELCFLLQQASRSSRRRETVWRPCA